MYNELDPKSWLFFERYDGRFFAALDSGKDTAKWFPRPGVTHATRDDAIRSVARYLASFGSFTTDHWVDVIRDHRKGR